jgi:MFS family permease
MTDVSVREQTTAHRLPVRTLVAASIGNAIEWYDWTVYATFSIYFATQIFSAENESLAFIGTFATYALAFFFRPLGGVLLGRYADLRGRKQAMILTITLMAGGSLIIAVLPTYNQVGWLAPILLLVARIGQGMSLGGEVSNASAYLGEIAPPERRCATPRSSRHWHPSRSSSRLDAIEESIEYRPGGTAPLVIQWLGNLGHSGWFFWYVAVGAAVAFVSILTLPETNGSTLR